MKVKSLQVLLRTLKAAGVSSYTVRTPEETISLTFGPVQEVQPDQVETPQEAGQQEAPTGPMELPDGVFDPLAALRKINLKHGRPV